MAALSMPLAVFIGLLCEAVLYGIYTALAGGAMTLLIRKPRQRRYKSTNLLMLTLTVLMYLASTVHITLSIRAGIKAFYEKESTSSLVESPNDPTVWIQLFLESLNCVMGDIIVCWRTWELWERKWRVLAFPMTCIVGGLTCGIGMTHALSQLPNGVPLTASPEVMIWFGGFGALTVVSNVYSVVLIGWKAWEKTRMLKGINLYISGGTYFSVLVLIIESGALYCVALAITFALFMADSAAVYIMADIVIHLTGIYPTIIIVLVCLQLTCKDNFTRAETSASTSHLAPVRDCHRDGRPDFDSKSGSKARFGSGVSRRVLSWRFATNTDLTSTAAASTMDSGTTQLQARPHAGMASDSECFEFALRSSDRALISGYAGPGGELEEVRKSDWATPECDKSRNSFYSAGAV
ncbi:hypothetical protein C8Q80DRAFT_953258 [Daedaleopsis nitida]|nr:hypothetical protein C8Q80DRAFT_953258 [Daedaleopsis nitida]